MDEYSIKLVLESCLLNIDGGYSKDEIISYKIPEELVDMGIKLHEYLKEKKLGVVKSG